MQRDDAAARFVQFALMAGEVVGQEGDRRQFEDLRRLETEPAEPDPGVGVVDRGADARDERQHHRPRCQDRAGITNGRHR